MTDHIVLSRKDFNEDLDSYYPADRWYAFTCPNCVKEKGLLYQKRKFYYRPEWRWGHCFVCGARLKRDYYDIKSYEIDNIEKRVLDYLKFFEKADYFEEEKTEFKTFDLKFWTKTFDQEKYAVDYITERGLTKSICKKYDLHCMSSFDREIISFSKGVIFVDNLEDTYTNFYQIRFMSNTFRYFMPETQKPLCWLDRVNNTPEELNLVLCEGFFSGLAFKEKFKSMLKVDPLILLGKSLSEFQKNQLQGKYFTEWIDKKITFYVCLDGGYNIEARKIAEFMSQKLVDARIVIVNLEHGKDPNDYSFDKLSDIIPKISFEDYGTGLPENLTQINRLNI